MTAPALARATLIESRSLDHARTLGASRLGLSPSQVELEVLSHPTPHKPIFQVRVSEIKVGGNLVRELSAIEDRLGAVAKTEVDEETLSHLEQNPRDYDAVLLESALQEVDTILKEAEPADPEIVHAIKQLSMGLHPELSNRVGNLRVATLRREEETEAEAGGVVNGAIEVQISSERREAWVIFRPPAPSGTPLTLVDAIRKIEEMGAMTPPIKELERIIERVKTPRAGHCMLTLGFRPGRFILQISPDEMELSLSIYPPGGPGEAVTFDAVRTAIRAKKICVNVDEDLIKKTVDEVQSSRDPVFDLVVARGRIASSGVDAVLNWMIPAVQNENDVWNLDAEAETIVADKGRVLLKVTAARDGSPGLTVLGRALPSAKGKPCPIAAGSSVRQDAQGQFLAIGPGRVGLRRNILAVSPYEAACAELNLDKDRSRAELVLIPQVGDAPTIKLDAIEKLLDEKQVTFCVDYELIHRMIEDLQTKKRRMTGIVAIGVPPLLGRPGFIDVPVIDVISQIHAEESPVYDGAVDYRERSAVRRVRAGEIVAMWYPADPGSPGVDVAGVAIPQPVVPDMAITARTGVERHDNVYQAVRDGHLIVTNDSVSVEDIYHVKGDLTLATGNIRHNGTVIIDGSVGDNFITAAEGEIVIRDNLGASDLSAKTNIRIGNGFVGRQRGIAHAGSDVEVKFVENAKIEAGGGIRIANFALQATLECEGLLEVLGPKSGVVGGVATARAGCRLSHVGSPAHVPTYVSAGRSPALTRRAENLDAEFQTIQSDLVKLEQLEVDLRAAAPTSTVVPDAAMSLARILKARVGLKHRLRDVGIERIRVARDSQSSVAAEITVTGTAHPGVTVAIADVELHLNAPLTNVRFTPSEDRTRINIEHLH